MAKRKVADGNQRASSWVCARQADHVIREQGLCGARPVSELLSVPFLSGPLANREKALLSFHVFLLHAMEL